MRKIQAPPVGFEPTTHCLEGSCAVRCAKGASSFDCSLSKRLRQTLPGTGWTIAFGEKTCHRTVKEGPSFCTVR